MSLTIINDASLGLGVVPIATRFGNLQEFEKGRIHHLDELLTRTKLLYFTRNFFNSAFCKNSQKPFSYKATLAVLTIPSILAFVKSSYASHYVNPKVVSVTVRIEKHIGKLCYISAFINAIALVCFGHLTVGYTALAIFGLDMTTSFTPILKRFPQMCKIRIVFIHYISPFATLVNGLAIRSYITIAFSVLAIYSLLQAQRRVDKKTKESHYPLKYSEFTNFLNGLQNEDIMLLEMNRERVPLIKIPVLDSTKYNPDKLLEFFDAINWNDREIRELLCKRVSDIPQVGKKDWLQAKKIAQTWLENVLNTPEPELLLFKQHVCKMLLENEDLLKSKTQTEQSRNFFKGLLTFIFGSGGECRIAQSMKIKEGFLEIYKSYNKTDETQNNLLLLLELQYKNITEQTFRDTLNPILQQILDLFSVIVNLDFTIKKRNLTQDWKPQRLAQIPVLALAAFNYLQAKYWTWSIEEFRKQTDLNSVHNFSQVAKFFGEVFNITSDVDEVAEKFFSELIINPLSPKALALTNKIFALTIGRFYWNTQLEKIIPLLKHYFKNDILKLNDLLSWFHNLLEDFKSLEQLNEQDLEKIDAIQEELQKEQPTINGLAIIEKYEYVENKMVPILSDKALILFAYCINLLKIMDSESRFNGIDQNLKSYEWSINVESEIQPMLQSIEALFCFLPQSMRSYIEEHLENIEDPRNMEKIGNFLDDCQILINQLINKEALFFAG